MGIEVDAGYEKTIDLSSNQLRLVLEMLRTHLPGVAVWAYGSRVRGNARRYSDLDLVAFTEPEHATRLNVLREAFEESSLPYRVDLFSWSEIPEAFRQQIASQFAVLQGRETGLVSHPDSQRRGETPSP